MLSHVVKDHGLSLKPAHLSYKCTVCTATFTMYKLFENHVYTAHSVVARKVLDKEKVEIKKSSSSGGGGGGGGSSSSVSGGSGALRINDEITIIPQTTTTANDQNNAASRPSRADKRGRVDVIDLSDDEDAANGQQHRLHLPKSQVTITKVPAPKGFLMKTATAGSAGSSSSRSESVSKRSRMLDDNDTE